MVGPGGWSTRASASSWCDVRRGLLAHCSSAVTEVTESGNGVLFRPAGRPAASRRSGAAPREARARVRVSPVLPARATLAIVNRRPKAYGAPFVTKLLSPLPLLNHKMVY